jgi:AcrR family transcriptional regulator
MASTMRKDAARSRRAILDAARDVYADDLIASFAEIAVRAGVGQATVYRHFADRRALLDQLALEDMARLEERVEAEPIGPDSLEALFREFIAAQLRSQGLIEAIRAGEVDEGRIRELTDRCRDLFAPRLEAARAAGRVRPDITVEHLIVTLGMIDGALAAGHDRAERERATTLAFEIALEGLRSRQ